MGLLEAVRQIRTRDQELVEESLAKERSELIQLAMRDYLGKPKEDDPERLLQILELLELKDDDYLRILNGCQKLTAAAGRKANCDALSVNAYAEQLKAQGDMYRMEAEKRKAKSRMVHWRGVRGQASNAATSLRQISEEVPELFDEDGNPRAELKPEITRIQKECRQHFEKELEQRYAATEQWRDELLKRHELEQVAGD